MPMIRETTRQTRKMTFALAHKSIEKLVVAAAANGQTLVSALESSIADYAAKLEHQ